MASGASGIRRYEARGRSFLSFRLPLGDLDPSPVRGTIRSKACEFDDAEFDDVEFDDAGSFVNFAALRFTSRVTQKQRPEC